MYVIKETFTAKPGMASKLASMFKETSALMSGMKVRVLTDAVGPFNTVVLETEVSDLGEFERRMREYGERADFRDRMKGYTDLYQGGRREIFRVM